jgi:hypothetical protein
MRVLSQYLFVIPGSVGDQMMERLVHAPDVIGSQTGSPRLDAFALTGKQQSFAV